MSIRNLWEITGDVSVLIVFLAVIRKIFKKKLNPNGVYFLWIFVLICILIPIRLEVNLEAPFKAPYQEQGTIYNVPLLETVKLPEGILPFIDGMGTAGIKPDNMEADSMSPDGMGLNSMKSNSMSLDSMNSDLSVSKSQRKVSLNGVLYAVWGSVAAAFLFYIVLINIRLYLYVKHNRKPAGRWKGLQIYSLSGYNCLMGILHPAIYVDKETLGNEELIHSVMRHEYRHFQAKDNIWQLLRTLCLILQWHNPLVWWAYYASKQDCELACDASVVGKLSEEARYQYGRCLLTISEHKSRAAEGMLLATSIGESAERLKERIELIMKYQQKKTTVLAILLFCTIGFVSVAAVKVVKADNEFFMKESDENIPKWGAFQRAWKTSQKQLEASQKEWQEPYTVGEWMNSAESSIETNAKIIYDKVLAEQGYTYEVCYNAKGNLYLNLGSRPAGDLGDYYNTGTYCFTLVYDRTSKNQACELFVLYKEHYAGEQGDLSLNDTTAILDMYAVEIGTGKVVAADKQSWSDVGTREYRELTGE